MTTNIPQKAQESPIAKLKTALSTQSVQEQFRNAMADNAPLFIASLIDVYASDTYLQKCSPNLVIMEALKAATLKLPINKGLGFAYIVPYGKSVKVGNKWDKQQIPQFQIGYRGYIQLAMRTGAYRFINADVVFDGELQGHNKITGEIDLSGTATSESVIGYFAYIETVNGFKKCIFWTHERVLAHAKRYSKSFNHQSSAWQSNFNEMALKTMLRNLLSKYGVMSVEMVSAFTSDTADERTPEARLEDDINDNANSDTIDVDMATGEVIKPHPWDRKNWINLKEAGFPTFVYKNKDTFESAPEEVKAESEKKWNKMFPETPFPCALVEPEETENNDCEAEQVSCPDLEPGETRFVSYCDVQCLKRKGCPSFDDDNGQPGPGF